MLSTYWPIITELYSEGLSQLVSSGYFQNNKFIYGDKNPSILNTMLEQGDPSMGHTIKTKCIPMELLRIYFSLAWVMSINTNCSEQSILSIINVLHRIIYRDAMAAGSRTIRTEDDLIKNAQKLYPIMTRIVDISRSEIQSTIFIYVSNIIAKKDRDPLYHLVIRIVTKLTYKYNSNEIITKLLDELYTIQNQLLSCFRRSTVTDLDKKMLNPYQSIDE